MQFGIRKILRVNNSSKLTRFLRKSRWQATGRGVGIKKFAESFLRHAKEEAILLFPLCGARGAVDRQ